MNLKTYLFAGWLMLLFAFSLHAQTQTNFTGLGGNNEWFNPANWTQGLPEAGKKAFIGGGSVVTISQPLTIDFEVESYGDITIKAMVTNNNSVFSDGSITFSTDVGLNNFGTLTNAMHGSVIFNGNATFANNLGASLLNQGIFTLKTLLDNHGTITNFGTMDASAGTLQTEGAFNNNNSLTTQSLKVLPGSVFTNDFGTIEITSTGMGILVQGKLNNFGQITNHGDLTIENLLDNLGTLVSEGGILVKAGAELRNSGGTVDNQGTLTNNGKVVNGNRFLNSGSVKNLGLFTNNFLIHNQSGGSFTNHESGKIEQGFGTQIINDGDFLNENTIYSYGQIVNNLTFVNDDSITSVVGSVIANHADFTNNGEIIVNNAEVNNLAPVIPNPAFRFTNNGLLTINAGSSLNNFAHFTNSLTGVISNLGVVANKPGGEFENSGDLSNEFHFVVEGTVVNYNYFENAYDIFILPVGLLVNHGQLKQIAGNIRNEGSLFNGGEGLGVISDECSTISNQGGIIDNLGILKILGILFQNGTLTGEPIILEGGYIHNSPAPDAPAICKDGAFGADVHGDVKVYAVELVAYPNFDNCSNLIYLANGLARPVFACSDIGSVLDVSLSLKTRLGDELTCTAKVTPKDILEPQFTTPCPDDILITTTETSVAVSWAPPVAVDNCTITTLTATHQPGDVFPAGPPTTVAYQAIDAYGNVNNCAFNVLITGMTTCTTNNSPANGTTGVDFSSVTLSWNPAPNALIYDVYLGTENPPATLVAPGVPATSVEVMNLLGNTVYYWYVVPKNTHGSPEGCTVNVTQFSTALPCSNVTNAGTIAGDQTLCDATDPVIIASTAAASGGSNTLEYLWQQTTLDPATHPNAWTQVPGQTSLSYDPANLTASTWFRRGARRSGCGDYLFTQPTKVTLINSVEPVIQISQANCGIPTGTVQINNLPAGWYSKLDGNAPVTGQTTYSGLAPGPHSITIGLEGCDKQKTFEISQFYTPPVAVCKNITRELGTNGQVVIAASELDGGSSASCNGQLSFTVNQQPALTLNCNHVGTTTVTLTAADALNNQSSCSALVKIEDKIPPTVVCKDITIELEANGQVGIFPADVSHGMGDNCGSANFVSVAPNNFTCANLGVRPVMLIVQDGSGNTATCTALVTVKDTQAPVISCKNATVQLDENGKASIVPSQIFGDGSDNCGLANFFATPNQFDNIGEVTVELKVTDNQGNTATCSAKVIVEDKIQPTVFCQDKTIYLDAAGKATITPTVVYKNGSDNTGINNLSVIPDQFSCSNVGTFPVLLTATDAAGNKSTCTAVITLKDDSAPVISCKNIAVQLDANGQAIISPNDVYQNGADNCGTVSLVKATPSTFNCSNLGENSVSLEATDAYGNTAICQAIVTVNLDNNETMTYAILAQEEIHVHKNTIFGNVGVWKTGHEAKIHDKSTVNGFLRASKTDISGGSVVTGEIFKEQAKEPSTGSFKYNNMPDPKDDTKVPDNYPGVFLLEGNNFKKIEIGKNSTALFTSTGEIYIKELILKDADNGKQTQLLFSGNTELVLRRRGELGKRSAVNTDEGGSVKIYLEENDFLIRESSLVNASIDVRFKNLKIDKAKEEAPTVMAGQFIAKKVDADNFVQWQWQPFGCGQNRPKDLVVSNDQLGFTANTLAETVKLQWITNTESKNDHFVVERSSDGFDFEPIFEVPAQAKDNDVANYLDEDAQPALGANFYRVRAVFEDGNSIVSEVRRVDFSLDRNDLNVFPNPANDFVFIFRETYAGQPATIRVSNATGIVLKHLEFDALPSEPVRLDVGNLPEGFYQISLQAEGFREIVKKLIVSH